MLALQKSTIRVLSSEFDSLLRYLSGGSYLSLVWVDPPWMSRWSWHSGRRSFSFARRSAQASIAAALEAPSTLSPVRSAAAAASPRCVSALHAGTMKGLCRGGRATLAWPDRTAQGLRASGGDGQAALGPRRHVAAVGRPTHCRDARACRSGARAAEACAPVGRDSFSARLRVSARYPRGLRLEGPAPCA